AWLERVICLHGREIGGFDDGNGSFQMRQLAQLLRGHRDLMRTAAAEDGDGPDRRMVERIERMADDVGPFELMLCLRQDPRAIQRHVSVPDNCGMSAVEERVEVGEVRMPVVPADELGGADDAMQV